MRRIHPTAEAPTLDLGIYQGAFRVETPARLLPSKSGSPSLPVLVIGPYTNGRHILVLRQPPWRCRLAWRAGFQRNLSGSSASPLCYGADNRPPITVCQ